MNYQIDRKVYVTDSKGKVVKLDLNNLFEDEHIPNTRKEYMRKILKDIFASYCTQKQAEVAYMYYAEMKSLAEIAEATNRNKSTICRDLAKAKRELSTKMGHYKSEFLHIAAAKGDLGSYY